MGNRGIVLHTPTPQNKIPRCPFCHARMEEVQLVFAEDPKNAMQKIWQEVWNCDSCHTNHVFPARLELMERVRNSQLMERGQKVNHLPF